MNPAVCHGKPVVRGTRVLVAQLLGALAGGDSIEDVLADYPSVTAEDLSAVFATGREVSELFAKYGVSDYVMQYFDSLHTTGVKYIVADIADFIRSRAA